MGVFCPCREATPRQTTINFVAWTVTHADPHFADANASSPRVFLNATESDVVSHAEYVHGPT